MSRWTYDCQHTGPGTLAGRYLRSFWQPVARLADLAPKSAIPLRIMAEDFTLYRGESGEPHVIAPRCAHRGTLLSVGWVEGEELRCRYHGWKYARSGQCVEQPGEGQHAFCDRVRIAAYPTRSYKGLVFAYLGEGAPPELPIFAELDTELIETTAYYRDCNLTNFLDNQLDEVHVAFTHADAFRLIPEIPEVRIVRTSNSAISYCKRPGRAERVTAFLMPNILRLKIPPLFEGSVWADGVVWRVPIDDNRVLSFGVNAYHTDADTLDTVRDGLARQRALPVPAMNELARDVLAGRTTIEDVKAALGPRDEGYDINLEDHVVMCGQGVVASRRFETLGSADEGVCAVRDLWSEALEKFSRNEPVDRDIISKAVTITSGQETNDELAPSSP